jgi:hypothetical protein
MAAIGPVVVFARSSVFFTAGLGMIGLSIYLRCYFAFTASQPSARAGV